MLTPTYEFEQALLSKGFSFVGGVDEVGRGCWAGPVVACCVVLPTELLKNENMKHVRDSKTVTKKRRALLNTLLKSEAGWGIGEASNLEIDSLGIGNATQLAMERAIANCTIAPDTVLIDGREQLKIELPQQAIIDGDALSITIAAASIIAKEYRDTLMEQFDAQYAGYAFGKHVGYGTKIHQVALANLGPSPIHRYSFKPVKAHKKL
jgi:ribonuclease HII